MLDGSSAARTFVSGPAGPAGESAYQAWLAEGNTGTRAKFLASLRAKDGRDGQPGAGAVVTRTAAAPFPASTNAVSLDGVTCVPADPTDPTHLGKVIGLVVTATGSGQTITFTAAPCAAGALAMIATGGAVVGVMGEFGDGDPLYVADGTGAAPKGGLTRSRPTGTSWVQQVGRALTGGAINYMPGLAAAQKAGAPDIEITRIYLDQGGGTEVATPTALISSALPFTPVTVAGVTAPIPQQIEDAATRGLTAIGTALTPISGQRVLRRTSAGLAQASATVRDHATAVVGISLTAAAAGNPVAYRTSGLMEDAAFDFAPGPVFLGANGLLTQVYPEDIGAAFVLQVGLALSKTEILVDIDRPIFLIN